MRYDAGRDGSIRGNARGAPRVLIPIHFANLDNYHKQDAGTGDAKTVSTGAIGHQQSGLGREGGAAGIDEFVETKAIMGCPPPNE